MTTVAAWRFMGIELHNSGLDSTIYGQRYEFKQQNKQNRIGLRILCVFVNSGTYFNGFKLYIKFKFKA